MNNQKINFGIHKGKYLKDIPKDYLKWLVDSKIIKGTLMVGAKKILNYPTFKFKVTVKNSIDCDGVYIVDAHNYKEAILICQVENRIKNSQNGTEYIVGGL